MKRLLVKRQSWYNKIIVRLYYNIVQLTKKNCTNFQEMIDINFLVEIVITRDDL